MLSRLLRGLGALLVLTAGVAGVPPVLILLGGNPFPDRLDWAGVVDALFRPDDGSVLIGLITIIAWLAWLIFTVSVFAEVIGRVAGYRIILQVPGMAAPQRLVAGLVVAVITMITVPAEAEPRREPSSVVSAEPVEQQHSDGRATAPPQLAVDGPRGGPEQRAARVGTESGDAAEVLHRVKPGDDLWTLAERYYGDGWQWRKIAAANPERLSGGPDVLQPGWVLLIPDVDPSPEAGERTVRVRPGDSLWAIAERTYGDPERWPEIYRVNQFQLNDPDELEIGMRLVLPAESGERSGKPSDPQHGRGRDADSGRQGPGQRGADRRAESGERSESEAGPRAEERSESGGRSKSGGRSEDEGRSEPGRGRESPGGHEPDGDAESQQRSEHDDERGSDGEAESGERSERESRSEADGGAGSPEGSEGGSRSESSGGDGSDAGPRTPQGREREPDDGSGPGARSEHDDRRQPDAGRGSGDAESKGGHRPGGDPAAGGPPAPESTPGAPSAPPAPMPSDPSAPADPTTSDRTGGGAAPVGGSAPVPVAEADSAHVAAAVAGLAGVGGLLSAALIGGLAARRRMQLQRRPLGRRLPPPSAPARAVEATLGRRQQPLGLRALDQALRAISAHCHATATPLPPLRLAAVGADEIELIFEGPVGAAPAGFTVREASWLVSAEDVGYLRTIPGFAEATRPYPALVGLGTDREGRSVLADLEGLGLLAVESDDPELAPALLAAIATELSFSPAADELILTLVGDHPALAEVLGRHNVARADDLDDLLGQLERRAAVQRREQVTSGPVALLRSNPDLADPWAPEIVLVDRTPTQRQRERLTAIVAGTPAVTVAVVVPGGAERAEWTLRLDGDPADAAELLPLGIRLAPQLLRPAAVDAVVELIAATGTEDTDPAPWWFHGVNGHAVPGRRRDEPGVVAAGGGPVVTDEESPPRGADPPDNVTRIDRRLRGWGEAAAEHQRTRATMQGEGEPGPGQVHHPTLRMLGGIELDGAAGPVPPRADKQCLEYCGWLLEHPGSTARAMAAALAIAEGTRRSNMSRLRSWLGVAPDGDAYLPDAYSGRIALHPAVSSDWHRLQILTLGGVNRTGDDSLFAALELVRGAPLADAAPGQWHWAEELRTDMISAVRDIGVELCRRALERNDLDLARWSAARALAAAPGDELLLVARIRTEHQAGNHAETERLALQLAGHARLLGVDLDPDTVRVLQQVMEGQVRARLA